MFCNLNIPLPPAPEGWGKVIFSVCLSVHTQGYPNPRFLPGLWSQVLSRGIPQTWLGVPLFWGTPGQDWGTLPWPGLGYPPHQDCGTPSQDRLCYRGGLSCWWMILLKQFNQLIGGSYEVPYSWNWGYCMTFWEYLDTRWKILFLLWGEHVIWTQGDHGHARWECPHEVTFMCGGGDNSTYTPQKSPAIHLTSMWGVFVWWRGQLGNNTSKVTLHPPCIHLASNFNSTYTPQKSPHVHFAFTQGDFVWWKGQLWNNTSKVTSHPPCIHLLSIGSDFVWCRGQLHIRPLKVTSHGHEVDARWVSSLK